MSSKQYYIVPIGMLMPLIDEYGVKVERSSSTHVLIVTKEAIPANVAFIKVDRRNIQPSVILQTGIKGE